MIDSLDIMLIFSFPHSDDKKDREEAKSYLVNNVIDGLAVVLDVAWSCLFI